MTSFSSFETDAAAVATLEFPVDDEIPRLDEDESDEEDVVAVDAAEAVVKATEEFKHCCNFFNCVSIVSIRSRKLSESCKNKIHKIITRIKFLLTLNYLNFRAINRISSDFKLFEFSRQKLNLF